MACKYMVFLPLFLVFLVHRIVFSPYFSSLKSRTTYSYEGANLIWEKLMSCLRFRPLPSNFSRFASAPFDDPSHPASHDPSSQSPSHSSSLRQVVICWPQSQKCSSIFYSVLAISKPTSLCILQYLSYWLRHYGWEGKGIQPSASDWLEKRPRIDRSQWKGCFALCAGHWIQSRYHFYYKDPLKAEDFKYTN